MPEQAQETVGRPLGCGKLWAQMPAKPRRSTQALVTTFSVQMLCNYAMLQKHEQRCGAQVRTPLNGCLASAEMLLETPLGAEQRELAKTIRVSGSILLSTVSNFLDFFKMEAGKQLDVVRTEMDVEARPEVPLINPILSPSATSLTFLK